MLGWILAGLALGAAVITISYLTAGKAKEKAKELNSNASAILIKSVFKNGNVNRVKMDILDDYNDSIGELDYSADDISSDIYEGNKIYI